MSQRTVLIVAAVIVVLLILANAYTDGAMLDAFMESFNARVDQS